MSTLLSDKWVKTRKQHRCFGCAKEYPKGSCMLRVSLADDETVWSYYICKVCQEYVARYAIDLEICTCGDILDSDPDGWEELRQEILKEEEKKSNEE